MSIIGTGPSVPGASFAALTAFLNEFWWGGAPNPYYVSSGQLVSTAVDAGNTPTTTLRAGLVLGRVTSSGKYKEWNPDGTDGSEVAAGILVNSVSMLNIGGTAADKYVGWILTRGHVRSSKILVPGGSTVGISSTSEYMLRRQLRYNFNLDDAHLYPVLNAGDTTRAAAADLAVTYQMNGMKFIATTGAVNFTLPAIPYRGLVYEFFNNIDANMTITSTTADTITTDGDLTADSVVFSTTSHKIGGHARVEGLVGVAGATGRWMITNLSTGCTMTINT